jgi:hypothetical protein
MLRSLNAGSLTIWSRIYEPFEPHQEALMAFFDSAWVQILITELNPRRAGGATEHRVLWVLKCLF